MARTRINPRLVKLHRPYTIAEAAETLGVTEATVRRWMVDHGLQPVDDGRPALIKGAVLRAHLERRRARPVREKPPGTIYCFGCAGFRRPAPGLVEFVIRETAKAGDLRGLCEQCGSIMHRAARQDELTVILPGMEVRVVEAAPRIVGCAGSPVNGNLEGDSAP